MSNSEKIILDLCGGTGSWSRPYKEAGYDVRIITLPDNDVLTYEPPENVYGILAAPPCTHFCNASSQYWNYYDSIGLTEYSLSIVRRCFDLAAQLKPKFFALENPKGRLRKLIPEQPIYEFYQYEFGGNFTKKTYLWGNFNTFLVKGPVNDKPIRFDEAKMSEYLDVPDDYKFEENFSKRQVVRSMYPPAFANAFYEVNK